jgi:chlorobactene glucosyltransferase
MYEKKDQVLQFHLVWQAPQLNLFTNKCVDEFVSTPPFYQMISILLFISISYLLIISVIFGMNRRDFEPLLPVISPANINEAPLISICIPARNEESVIERAVKSALEQHYPRLEVLVLDDESTDRTPNVLNELKEKYPGKLSIINGETKPDDWLGKSWACHQLSRKAKGEILYFIDADVWLGPAAVQRAIRSLDHFDIDFLTVWPLQELGTFWEKLVIPVLYYGLLTLLPARYVYENPRWLPSSLADRTAPVFAAACGQCMVFRREAYEKIGGHESVKQDIVEDVALAKQIRRNGFRMRMFHGEDAVWCRMYTSGVEMWDGFRKNFLAIFDNSVPKFLLMALMNFIVYVCPPIILAATIWTGNTFHALLAGASLLLMITQRVILAGWYQWSTGMAFLQPLSVLWFHVLGIRVLFDHYLGERARWKDRPTS